MEFPEAGNWKIKLDMRIGIKTITKIKEIIKEIIKGKKVSGNKSVETL